MVVIIKEKKKEEERKERQRCEERVAQFGYWKDIDSLQRSHFWLIGGKLGLVGREREEGMQSSIDGDFSTPHPFIFSFWGRRCCRHARSIP
jgi:hypothetical protein